MTASASGSITTGDRRPSCAANSKKKHKLKFRPTPITRLLKYDSPPPMVGDPDEARTHDWDKRCRAIYDYMIALKKGIVPNSQRRGLWFYATTDGGGSPVVSGRE